MKVVYPIIPASLSCAELLLQALDDNDLTTAILRSPEITQVLGAYPNFRANTVALEDASSVGIQTLYVPVMLGNDVKETRKNVWALHEQIEVPLNIALQNVYHVAVLWEGMQKSLPPELTQIATVPDPIKALLPHLRVAIQGRVRVLEFVSNLLPSTVYELFSVFNTESSALGGVSLVDVMDYLKNLPDDPNNLIYSHESLDGVFGNKLVVYLTTPDSISDLEGKITGQFGGVFPTRLERVLAVSEDSNTLTNLPAWLISTNKPIHPTHLVWGEFIKQMTFGEFPRVLCDRPAS